MSSIALKRKNRLAVSSTPSANAIHFAFRDSATAPLPSRNQRKMRPMPRMLRNVSRPSTSAPLSSEFGEHIRDREHHGGRQHRAEPVGYVADAGRRLKGHIASRGRSPAGSGSEGS